MKAAGYMYTFVVQCKGLIDHATTQNMGVVRIKSGEWIPKFMEIMAEIKDKGGMEYIDIGDIDLEHAPLRSNT